MKKYMLLLSVSILAFSGATASALTAAQQLKAMKEVFISDFAKMDDNKDGVLSREEYLSHQFENFRANIIEADGFEPLSAVPPAPKAPAAAKASPTAPKDAVKSLSDVKNTLQEMADFDLDEEFGDELALEENPATLPSEPKKLTREDVMPEGIEAEKASVESELPELDLSVSEDDSLKGLLDELNETPEQKAAKQDAAEAAVKAEADAKAVAEKAAGEAAKRDAQIGEMLETVKKTLPKKIDEMTTWTDIEYKNRAMAYIYQAAVDTSAFAPAEKTALSNSIKTESCTKAYSEMCPKVKPLFLKDGITLKIRYLDKAGTEIGSCEFNDETCK